MSITVKSPIGGFVAILPVVSCEGCPWAKRGNETISRCEINKRPMRLNGTMPDWCPAIKEAQDDIPGTADIDFLLNDGIESLKNEPLE